MLIISNHFVLSEVLSLIQKLKEGQNFSSAQWKYKDCLLSLNVATFQFSHVPFFRQKKKKKSPVKVSFFFGYQHVATGSCPLPRASRRSPAERLSRWSPPACLPLEECRPCPATWSRSPPPEPESWGQDNKTQLHTVH